jgi:hypothetical protein
MGETGLPEVSFYGGEMAIRKFSMTVAVRPQPMSGRYQFHVRVDLEANLGFVTGTREEFGEARRDEWPTPLRGEDEGRG